MTADDILTAARQCIGTPFRHQGRMLGFGLDCAGVAVHAARQAGLGVIEIDGYSRTPANGMLESALDGQPYLEQVAIDDRLPGDLLLMRFAAEPQHIAICAGETIIHAYRAAGKCCEHRLDARWAARIVRAYRFRGIE